jgi:TonB family protein
VGQAAGAKVIVSTVVTNLKDCAPFASKHRESLSAEDLQRWSALVQQGIELEITNANAEALKAYQAAAAIDDEYAELEFRIARTHCPKTPQPPRVLQNDIPYYPGGEKGIVTISLVVGTDGKTSDLKVVDSPNKASENAALEAVRKWQFKPATCEGEPMEVNIAVEVDFH